VNNIDIRQSMKKRGIHVLAGLMLLLGVAIFFVARQYFFVRSCGMLMVLIGASLLRTPNARRPLANHRTTTDKSLPPMAGGPGRWLGF